MRVFISAAMPALAALLATSASAAQTSDADAAYHTVHQFIDGFNTGDIESSLAACAPTAHIIDEFAPYAWSGENACAVWANDYIADASKKGLTDGVVTLRAARHVFVEGERAYVVAPVDYAYKIGGKASGQTGSTLTVALEKLNGHWKITQWAWSQGEPNK